MRASALGIPTAPISWRRTMLAMARWSRAPLFAGDPVVVVYPDGREVLFTPEQAHGMTALLLLLAVAWWRLQSRRTPADVVQLPPRTRVEARDSAGLPVAA